MSNQRFFRCPLCGFPHEEKEKVCPVHEQVIVRPATRQLGAESERHLPTARAAPAAPPAQEASALVGTTVDGKYHVHFVLGRGGMGTVYEAEQVTIGRRVAIKVLHGKGPSNDVNHRRFLQEAKVVANLPHTHICQVYDFGTLPDGSPFIVMERLEGETLADRLQWEGPMRFARALDITYQTLGALSFAHKRNVIHRDVKPENIFLAKTGKYTSAKLVDFGLSKVIASEPSDDADPGLDSDASDAGQLTQTGFAMGTPYYMAPEQALGDRTLDGRVDVWAVGVTLYECLAGKRPFSGRDTFDLMRAIAHAPHVPLAQLRAPLPEGLEALLSKALAKDRNLRFRSAGAFQRQLLPVLRKAANAEKEAAGREPPDPT